MRCSPMWCSRRATVPEIAEEAMLLDGTYYYQYAITDIFENSYESDMAMTTSTDGEITVELVAE
ncbi:MAG: hypothetical protein RSD23_04480 [Ruthenibacterium sp.]